MFYGSQSVRYLYREDRVSLGLGEGTGEHPDRLRQSTDLVFQSVYPLVGTRRCVQWGIQLPAHCLPSLVRVS
jgi:hypothetical protein